jgi:hypothetical protein
VPRCQVQHLKVFLVRPGRVLRHQGVISQPEHAGGKQLLPIAVLGKRSRLAHQPVNDVPVIHPVLVATPQTWQLLDQVLRVPHLHPFGIKPRLDHLPNQPAGHRVTVALQVNQAARVHATGLLLTRFQTPRRQGSQPRLFLRQALAPARVEPRAQLVQKPRIRFPAGKIPAAPQHQGLVHGLLETMMPLLDVAVLVGVIRLDLLTDQTVMRQQRLITPRELLPLRQIVDRRAQTVGAMPQRHAAQLPQRVLQPVAETLEALGKADGRRLPVRVGQHKVVDQVRERLPLDRHAQRAHVREIRGPQPAGFVDLAEEHFLGWSGQGPPASHLPLQGAQLAIGEATGVAALQLAEDRFGLKSRLLLQQCLDLRPDRGERIAAGGPIVPPGQGAGQLLQPPILACRFVIHVGSRRGDGQRLAGRHQSPQLPHLSVRDHRKPPCMKNLRIV